MRADAALTADVEARRLAQTQFERPVCVEAGAGTGKTTVLVARLLAWCLGRGWERAENALKTTAGVTVADSAAERDRTAATVLDGVVGITFTDAAASQMARRTAEALALLAEGNSHEVTGFDSSLLAPTPGLTEIADRAQALIGALDHLAIRTIHSHCLHLLVSHPLDAGISPDLVVDADGRILAEVVREVVEDAVKGAYDQPTTHPLALLSRWLIGPPRISDALVQLAAAGLSADALGRDPFSADGRREIRQRLATVIGTLAETVKPLGELRRNSKARAIVDSSTATLAALAQLPDPADLSSLARLVGELRQLWQPHRHRLRDWSADRFNGSERKALAESAEALQRAAAEAVQLLEVYLRLDIPLLDTGRRAIQPLIERIEELLRARGVATFNSLLRDALGLLSSRPSVLRRERRRVHQLLVDEFQDTDRLQCEIVRLLALDGPVDERPGLFVVGDPKQSIYGWRNADLAAYGRFLEELVAAGGVTARLAQNFRSVPTILLEVERAIQPVMLAERGLQPRFEPLQPCASLSSAMGFLAAGRAPVEYWVSWRPEASADASTPAATDAETAARIEAEAVAADIRNLHGQGVTRWKDCGLLLRSTTKLETFLEAFRRHGVPFAVARDRQYFRRREVIEAAALVRAIINPVDHLALVTLLRSPFVGVPDAALLGLWQRGLPSLVTEMRDPADRRLRRLQGLLQETARDLPAGITGIEALRGWEASAMAALENLALLRRALEIEPADRFIELLRRRFLLEVIEAGRYLGRHRLANLDRFFRRLERALEESSGDIEGVLRAVRRSVAEAEEAEGAPPTGAPDDAVQVMTIHAAKGLEFRHLYLVQLHAKPGGGTWSDIQVDSHLLPGEDAEYVLFGVPTPGFDRVLRREERVALAEQVRTLYVALTRARERLVLVGNWPAYRTPVAEQKRTRYIDLLQHRRELPASIAELLERVTSSTDGFVDAGQARWRFPAIADPSTAGDRARVATEDLPNSHEVTVQAELLSRHRRSAGEHMTRPMSAAASLEAGTRLARLLDEPRPGSGGADDRDLALAVGEAFHRMLQIWTLEAEPQAELERLRRIVVTRLLPAIVSRARTAAAIERFEALLARFRTGKLLRRFNALADHVVGRELSVLLPPGAAGQGPVGFVSGSIDLLYRDPVMGSLVIVDYKTDRIEAEQELEARAEVYSSQETVYARAVQEALDLQDPPACQLWFVWPDRVWGDPGGIP